MAQHCAESWAPSSCLCHQTSSDFMPLNYFLSEQLCGTAAIFGKTCKGGGQGSDVYVDWLVNMSRV